MLMKRLPILLLVCSAWHWKMTKAQGDDKCKDQLSYCNLIESFCNDPQHSDYAQNNCPATCKVCPSDIDPDGLCSTNNGDCEQNCEVEDKTIKKCTCYPGYKLNDDGKNCDDIDECQFESCPPGQHCSNTAGSFTCARADCGDNANEEAYMGRAECCQREPEDAECGVIGAPKPAATTRIIGGKDAYLGQWPWQVLIYIDKSVLCGGTLISRDWVVTAGHCFRQYKNSTTFDLYFGVVKINKLRRKHIQKRGMKKHTLYPNWKEENYEINDIALIQLDKPVEYTTHIRPVCLPNGEKPKVGTPCFAAGWGLTDEDGTDPSSTMQFVDLPIVNRSKCEFNYRDQTTKVNRTIMTCAGYDEGGKDACRGDSGGPLVCQRCDSCGWYLAGVVSFGSGCGRKNLYGVYADVPYYEEWIASQTSIHVTKDRSCTGPYLTQWANWSECTKTCGQGGEHTRTRECIDKGLVSNACTGTRTQTEDCPTKKCPTLGEWGQWTDCSRTCGRGERTRLRKCENGKLGEDGCPDDQATDTELCSTQNCPRFSPWSGWGDCSASCGGGEQEAIRSCQDGEVGEKGCVGPTKRSQDCATNECAGKLGSWEDWSPCTETCGEGTQNRNRLCVGGTNCKGVNEETRNCEVKKCPVFGEWTEWTDCTLSCGGGDQSRTRECLHASAPNDCKGDDTQRQNCNEQSCPGKWTEWSDWSTCDASCDKGTTRRSRDCEGGEVGKLGCENGEQEETGECELKACLSSWGDWRSWSSCSKSCDRGLQTRMRPCNGGKAGSGGCVPESDAKEEKPCNEVICTDCFNWQDSYCDTNFATPNDCRVNRDFAERYCPVKCQLCRSLFEHWNQWGPCSTTCGKGIRQRTRECKNFQVGCDGEGSEEEECQGTCRGFSSWSEWSQCTVSCNGGVRTRSRSCPFPKCNPDEKGSVALSEEEDCGVNACPGKWGAWGEWSDCSVTCGDNGSEEQKRECMGGRPGGPGCLGSDTRTRPCSQMSVCPGKWTEWGDWASCPVSCGTGRRERRRRCENGIPGQLGCEGTTTDTETCDAGECVVKWGEWEEWGECDASCVRRRNRQCSGGRPGNKGCEGVDSETESCDASACGVADEECDHFLVDIGGDCASMNKRFCRTTRGAQFCPKTCCETAKTLPCEDDPEYADTYCQGQWLLYCRDSRYQERLMKPFCPKSCGFC